MKRFDGKSTVMALGDKCVQLLHMHAITGCDTVSYTFGKGKVSSLKVIMDSDHLEIELYRMSCARDVGLSVVSTGQHVTLL